ncbi:MAG: hypothetical protein KUG78_02735 [Kangiellaceae bacterium]|nr:hypothetical protein [Kangiellaceae bacterium]
MSCSDSTKEVLEVPPESSYDNSLKEFSEFEGKSVTLTSTLDSASYQWEQLSGPSFEIASLTDKQIILNLPWIDEGPLVAEFNVTATINDQLVTQPVNLSILNRGYIIFQVKDESSSNLYIDYISENDEDYVAEVGNVQLTDTVEDTKICGFSSSPNGRYVSFATTTTDDTLKLNCAGLKVVDIETKLVQNVTPLNRQGEPVQLGRHSWAPDSLQILYVGDHGEDIDQIYVARVYTETVSYIHYGDFEAPDGQWPSEDLFPIGDGGNFENLDSVENFDIGNLFWLSDNNGIAISLYNHETGDTLPYQAASHGNAQVLERNTLVVADLYESEQDDLSDELVDCPTGGICTSVLPGPLRLTPITRRFSNPEWMASSVDGQLAQIITMITSNEDPMKVLSVRRPVKDGEVILEGTPIEATEVITAQWSPVDSSLAFSSHSDYRHRHAYVETFQEIQELMGYEVPDQLYWYPNYQQGHEQGQERLSRPQGLIDSNAVRVIKWSSDGKYIAYARGEEPETSTANLSSLWIATLDDVYDVSQQTIDANTVLLDTTAADFTSYSDFEWSPDSEGVMAIFQSEEGAHLRYFDREGGMLFESPELLGSNTHLFWFLAASFSPDGKYFVYLDKHPLSAEETQPAIYIYEISTGERNRIETPDLTSSGSITAPIQWSPHGDAVLYSVRPDTGSERIYYLAKSNNEHENMSSNFDLGEQIENAKVDDFVNITNLTIGPIQ